MEELDEQGMWWLPSSPDRKVAGRLTYTVQNGAHLLLNGSFREKLDAERRPAVGGATLTEDDIFGAGNYPRIHGQIQSKAITLDDCFRKRLKATSSAASQWKKSLSVACIGAYGSIETRR